jgi:phosphatidylserine/phosphatidylglycerophosphate/cardiolipin synthase-like enzyme
MLQRDVDWYNHQFDSLRITPKFTKGTPTHPYHPKRYLHDQIDRCIREHHDKPTRDSGIRVCVDCIDDTDFISHLLHAHSCGVPVQCVVDWRKMMLTTSANYARLKRSTIPLLGVFACQKHPLVEVDTDMHNKFVIFGDSHCLQGSFNITFERWWANWETGITFQSEGVCRLFENIFQAVRGGVIQRYGIDPLSPFNLLYTFGRHSLLNGNVYRPNHAILAEIGRARRSIRACLFLINELRGEHGESVVDALLAARSRGVDVQIILNGHMARQGDPAKERTTEEEFLRPVLPAAARLVRGGVQVALAYGNTEQPVPYCPLHAKYCVIDDTVVLDGSFNWYNTSVFSHDQLIVVRSPELARSYLHEFGQILRLFRFPAGSGAPFAVPEEALQV